MRDERGRVSIPLSALVQNCWLQFFHFFFFLTKKMKRGHFKKMCDSIENWQPTAELTQKLVRSSQTFDHELESKLAIEGK